MRNINNDLTLKRNYLSKYRFLISEYEQVKRGEHPQYRFAKDFYSVSATASVPGLWYVGKYAVLANQRSVLVPLTF